jgi:zinc/manganese transport system substrate-binding protein
MLKKIIALILFISAPAYAVPLHIVAAENFYGQIATEIGGQYVQVASILNNPKQDPHLFSTTPSTARAIAHADLIIYNGLDYDLWMENLITANSQKKPVIIVADLVNKKTGDNPHIWYEPNTMQVYAKHLVAELSKLDAKHQPYFEKQLLAFNHHYQQLIKQIDIDKSKFQHTPVIATEPVFNYMAEALGLEMLGQGLQLSIMNDTEPSATDIKDFQNQLTSRRAKVLISNNQVSDPLTQRMEQIAKDNNIPCIGVSEMLPLNQTYFTWMLGQLSTLEKALGEHQ